MGVVLALTPTPLRLFDDGQGLGDFFASHLQCGGLERWIPQYALGVDTIATKIVEGSVHALYMVEHLLRRIREFVGHGVRSPGSGRRAARVPPGLRHPSSAPVARVPMR